MHKKKIAGYFLSVLMSLVVLCSAFFMAGCDISITLHPNNGEDPYLLSDISNVYFAAHIYLPLPERDGYTFVEWNTNADGSGRSIPVDYHFYNAIGTNRDGIDDLYAIWEEKIIVYCDITFTSEEGSPKEEVVRAKAGEEVSLPTIKAPGKKLMAWLLNGASVGAPGDTYIAPEDSVVLVAQWEADPDYVEVTFDVGSGTLVASEGTVYVKRGETVVLPSVTPPWGTIFSGWYTKQNFAGSQGISFLVDTADSQVVLTAAYTYIYYSQEAAPVLYSVSFAIDGALQAEFPVAYAPPTITQSAEGSAITLPSVEGAEPGSYSWYNGEVLIGTAVALYTPASDILLTAKFIPEPVLYTVSFALSEQLQADFPDAVAPSSITQSSEGAAISLPSAESLYGVSYNWCDGGVLIGAAGSPYTPSGNVTLTACTAD